MTFSRTASHLFALLIVAGLLTNCSSPSSSSDADTDLPKTIGFSQKTVGGNWRITQTASIKSSITDQGTALLFDAGDGTQQTQINAINTFISKKVDLIVLDCVNDTGWDAILGSAKSAGIRVVIVDTAPSASDTSNYASYVGSDFANEGKQVAIALAGKLSSNATILEVLGTQGASSTTGRKQGFESELSTDYASKNFTVTPSSSYCNFDRAMAKTYVASYLGSNTAPAAIYAEDDEMALGAIEAITAAGKTPGVDIIVASINGEKEALQAVKSGKLYYTFDCNPTQGPKVIDICNKIYAGTTVAAANYMDERGYYQADVTDALINSRTY